MLALFFYAYPFSLAQDTFLQSQIISNKPGLSDRNVLSVYQSKNGFTWMGTQYGLNRYDGYDFKHFKAKENQVFEGLTAITEDHEGRLWLSLDKGDTTLYILNTQTGLVESVEQLYPTKKRIIDLYPQKFNNQLLVGSKDGSLYVYKDGRLELKQHHISNERVIDAQLAVDGSLWLVSQKPYKSRYLSIYNQSGNQIGSYDTDSLEKVISSSPLNWKKLPLSIADSVKKRLLAYFFPESMLGFVQITPHHGYYNAIEDELWLTKEGRIQVYKWKGDLLSLTNQYQLPGKIAATIKLIDQQGKLWLLLANNELAIINIQRNKFRQWLNKPGFSMRKMIRDKDKLYAASYNGIQVIDYHTGEHHPLLADLPLERLNKPFIKGNLSYSCNTSLTLIKRENYFWLGANYLVSFLPNEHVQIHDFDGGAKPGLFITALYPTQDTFWIGTTEGMQYLNPATQKVSIVTHLANEMPQVIVNAVIKETKSSFWVCTNDGLFLYKSESGEVEKYHSKGLRQYSFPFNHISHLHKDKKGIFWVSTKGGGLIKWNREKHTFKQLTIEDGLSNNVIYAVYEDHYEHLWLPSNNGLMQFNKKNEQVTNYLLEEGITHLEFNTYAHYQDKSGMLYFGGIQGMISFNPDDFYEEIDTTAIHFKLIECLVQNGKTGALEDKTIEYLEKNEIILAPENKAFEVKVAMLDFAKTSHHLYAFKLDGYHQKWQYQTEPNIRLGGIPYGKYQLRIKGKGERDVWSPQTLSIPVWVKKPFYLKNWFIGLVIVSIIGFIRWRFYVLERNKRRLEELVEVRTAQIQKDKQLIEEQTQKLRALDELKSRFFANVSHELRTPLTLINGLLQDVKAFVTIPRVKNDLQVIERNSQQLYQLVDEILELSALENEKLEIKEEPIALRKHMQVLVSAYLSFANYRGVVLTNEFKFNEERTIKIDITKFDKVVNNLLSNAIKFTPKGGTIQVVLEEQETAFLLEVRDTGSGISKEDLPRIFDRYYQTNSVSAPIQGGTGIGLALSKELSTVLNGDLQVVSELGKGTSFYFSFPKRIIEKDDTIQAEALSNWAMPTHEEDLEETIVNPKELTILIVEDHADMQQFIQGIFNSIYQVKVVSNGEEALQQLENLTDEELPDLIISDVMMPVMDGFTLLEKIKENKRLSHLPFVLLTARAVDADKLKALRMGVDDYLLKPFIREELVARANNLIANYQQRKEWLKSAKPESKEETQLESADLLLSEEDNYWLNKLEKVVTQKVKQAEINVGILADEMAISDRQLYRKMKQLTGLSPNKYIQEIRLQSAKQLLESNKFSSIKEVALEVGFKHNSYFSTLYSKRFGKSPSDYLKNRSQQVIT